MTTNQIMNTISLTVALAFVVWLVVHQVKKRREAREANAKHSPHAPQVGYNQAAVARSKLEGLGKTGDGSGGGV